MNEADRGEGEHGERRLPVPVLCLITDRKRFERPLAEVILEGIAGGVNLVQLREKDLSEEELLDLALSLREIIRGKALFLVNGSPEVARKSGADGVHLPAYTPFPPSPSLLVGASVHSTDEAQNTQRASADFLQVGHIFETASHPSESPRGLELLKEIQEITPLPLIAVGGIYPENAGECMRAGASGVAVISAIGASKNPRQAAQNLYQSIWEAWSREE